MKWRFILMAAASLRRLAAQEKRKEKSGRFT
jgi:hypothetical protein